MTVMERQEREPWNLGRLFGLLRRRIPVAAASAVLSGAVFLCAAALFMTPQYRAQAMLCVTGSDGEGLTASRLEASRELVDTCIALLDSRTVLEEAAAQAELAGGWEEAAAMVDGQSVAGTELFLVTAESADPQEAARLANAAAEVLTGRMAQLADHSRLQQVDSAAVPAEPVGPSYVLACAAGVFFGLAACVLTLVVLEERKTPQARTEG